jgi:RmlD substrate binding domain
VGWELRRSLLPLGEMIVLDRLACDLARPQDLPRIVAEARLDIIVNAAVYTAVVRAEQEEPPTRSLPRCSPLPVPIMPIRSRGRRTAAWREIVCADATASRSPVGNRL